MRSLRQTTMLLTTFSAWAAEAAGPLPGDPVDFFPAGDVLWPVVRSVIVGGALLGLAILAGLAAGAIWLAIVREGRADRRPRPALVDRNVRVVEGPVLTGGEWVRTVEVAGGLRRVEVLTRVGWRPYTAAIGTDVAAAAGPSARKA